MRVAIVGFGFVGKVLFNAFDKSIEILSIDKRIGNSHMNVPGHDGRLGYGGACFPKDARAFLKYSKDLDAEFTLLKNQ